MATDTHKFEAHYLDSLVGRYPEERAIYIERSPIHHLDQLSAILLLQGTEDRVVPPTQAEMLADAARTKHLPVALIMFEGEGHGFRRAETIKAATEAQIYFFGQILGFEPADRGSPTPDNCPDRAPLIGGRGGDTLLVSERGRRQRITSAIRATRSVAIKQIAPLIGGRARRHALRLRRGRRQRITSAIRATRSVAIADHCVDRSISGCHGCSRGTQARTSAIASVFLAVAVLKQRLLVPPEQTLP